MTDPVAIPTDNLLVARLHDAAMVRVEGRGNFRLGGALKQFFASSVREGCREVVVDCMHCQGMDSTFMGVLAGAARLHALSGRISVVNLSERGLRNLSTLGLTKVLDTHLAGQTPEHLAQLLDEAQTHGVDVNPEAAQDLTRTMLGAHEDLAALDDGNRERFRDVLAFLREDARRQAGE